MHDAPSLGQCHHLLRRASAGGTLRNHLGLAARAAGGLALLCRVDPAPCIAAAWLHDIGRAEGAVMLTAALTGRAPAVLAAMDHAALGACLLGASGGRFRPLAPAVRRHLISSVLGQSRPVTPVEQVVFIADKFVGQAWLGFERRMHDLVRRYGDRYDVRLCIPGAEAILRELAGRACLSHTQLERLVALAVSCP